MNSELVRSLLQRATSPDSPHPCLLWSLLIHEYFGGEIRTATSADGFAHYANDVYATLISLFDPPSDFQSSQLIDSPQLFFSVPHIRQQYGVLRERWERICGKRLSLPDVQHVLLCDDLAIAGTYANPDFTCTLYRAATRELLETHLFFPGQQIWLKYMGGPIVARAKLERWILGSSMNWSIDDIRGACKAYQLSRQRELWSIVAASDPFFFLLVFAAEPEVLDVPIYPAARSYGRAVVPLGNYASQISWLYASECDLQLNLPGETRGRTGPYHFKWEPLLAPEVTMALDDRMPRGGTYSDRVDILNTSLVQYFDLVSERAGDVLGAFGSDDIAILAEIAEGTAADHACSQRQLVDSLTSASEALALRGDILGAQLRELRSIVATLRGVEYAVLADEIWRVMATLEPPENEVSRTNLKRRFWVRREVDERDREENSHAD